MKKKLLTWVLASMLVAFASSAWAAVKAETFTFSPFIGGYTFDGAQSLKTGPVFGIRGGYNFTDNIGLEAVFDVVVTEPTKGPKSNVQAYTYRLEGLYHFMPGHKLVPFLALGAGGITVNNKNAVKNMKQGVVDYGGGVKYFLTDEVALRGDIRHLIITESSPLSNLEYTVGISFAFGGAKPAPAVVQEVIPEPIAQEPAVATEAPQEPPLEPTPAAEPVPGRYKYCVTLNIEYDIDSALIRPQYHDEAAKVGDFMKKYPDTTAVIEGYADEIGTAEHNMLLSQRRAENVVNYLVEKFGIDSSRLSAKGYGKTRPIADNSSEEGKQKNRRIEAIIDCTFVPKEAVPPERLCIALQIEFDSGSANVKNQFHDEIAKVGDYMKMYPTTTALIEGHTDNVGGSEYNMKLSQRRAENVVNYLVEKLGIERSRLSAKGYGFNRRIAYNNTSEGRQKNRRINAVIDCVIKK